MITIRQKGCSRKLCPERERKKRIWRLKGWPEITLPIRHYSLEGKGNSLYLLRDGEKISFFLKGVAGETVTNYASGYEAKLQKEKERREKTWRLKEYCEAPTSYCEEAGRNCDNCTSTQKEWALERKKEGKKVVRPRRPRSTFLERLDRK
ncbi:MAG: hypothetical protein Q8N87_01535 [bacterium]|nr:hypothetical protein [bacterium]